MILENDPTAIIQRYSSSPARCSQSPWRVGVMTGIQAFSSNQNTSIDDGRISGIRTVQTESSARNSTEGIVQA
ncbi:uncharacterized protein LOC144100354 [Amblyomma americanum]